MAKQFQTPVEIVAQPIPSAPASGFALFAALASNAFSWIEANGFMRTFNTSGITANRTYTLPNASGTLAFTRTDYKPGNFISSLDTLTVAGAGMGSTSLVVLRSFVLEASMTIDQLIVRITTAAAGSTFQLAIYNSSANGDPTGLPLANTASLTGAATGNIAGSITPLSLTANKLYWMAIAADNTTLAFVQGVTNSLKQAFLHGAESLAFISTSTVVSFNRTAPATYGTWPDLTGVSTSIDNTNRGAIQFFRIASVP